MRIRDLVAAALLSASSAMAQTPTVDVSLNVFPTNLANPNGGGTWMLFAKTDATIGIAGINAYIMGVDAASAIMESDIAGELRPGGEPFVVPGNPVNIVYFQDTANGPVLAGVGKPATSDGPDMLGDPAWDVATKIYSGTYPGAVPFFTSKGGNVTDANVLATVSVPANNSIDANTTAIVRVAVPEPAAATLAGLAVVAMMRRRRV